MRPLSPHRILRIWERGEGRDAQAQAEALLEAAAPERSPEERARLTLGQRDSLLLGLREQSLGTELHGYVRCPRCDVTLDFTVRVDQVRATTPAGADEDVLRRGDLEVRFRLPTGADLMAAARAVTVSAARAVLLERCVLAARREGRAVGATELSEEEIAALGRRMEEADPQAEVPLRMDCASCGHSWLPILDIGSFVWTEVAALASRLLSEVAALASAFGWSEEEILSLSAARRQRYLELAS